MTRFDRKVKKEAKNFKVPESYEKRVEETIQSLSEDDVSFPCERREKGYKGVLVFICACMICTILFSSAEVAQAGFLEMFRQTIVDFLGLEAEESKSMGIESRKDTVVGKPDLLIELQEKVIDRTNIYLIVKITAPTDIQFEKDISFDYFAFVEGKNYNTEKLIPGAIDCQLLEVLEGKKNIATYIVSLSSTQDLEMETEVTVFFKDLVDHPYSEQRNILVEGMWSVTFKVEPTVSEETQIKANGQVTYPFLDTAASLEEINLTPLGITIISDISKVDDNALGFSDMTVAIRLKMADRSELIVASHDDDEPTIVSSGSLDFTESEGKTLMTAAYQFRNPVEVEKVVGVYLEDTFLTFRESD